MQFVLYVGVDSHKSWSHYEFGTLGETVLECFSRFNGFSFFYLLIVSGIINILAQICLARFSTVINFLDIFFSPREIKCGNQNMDLYRINLYSQIKFTCCYNFKMYV
jgi:hypothetical protein